MVSEFSCFTYWKLIGNKGIYHTGTIEGSYSHMSSILFGDTMAPNIEEDYILLLGIVFYKRNIILLGSTTKKTLLMFTTKPW